jgi:RNA recognition motif-containing protein
MDINSAPFFIPPQHQQIPINNNFNTLQHIPPHMQPQHPPPMMMMMMMNKNSNDNTISSSSTSLIVRKIPKELNCEEKMREHFQKFGKITNILINYNNDPNSALGIYFLK